MAYRRIKVIIRGNRKTIDVDDLVENVTSEGDYVVVIFPGGGKQYLIGDDFKLYWTVKKPKDIKNSHPGYMEPQLIQDPIYLVRLRRFKKK